MSENTLQQSAIDELCSLAGVKPGDRDAIDSMNDAIWDTGQIGGHMDTGQTVSGQTGTEPLSLRACILPEEDELLVWRFIDGPQPARGYAGRVIETPSEMMMVETRSLAEPSTAEQISGSPQAADMAGVTGTVPSSQSQPAGLNTGGDSADAFWGSFLVFLLGAAGGGSGGGRPPIAPPVPRSISGVLHDGPVWGAKVYVDVNGNREVDNGDVLVDEQTDRFGNYSGRIAEQFSGLPLVSDNRGKDVIHVGSNQKLPDYLAAPGGATVISPLTHIISLWPSMDDPIRQAIKLHPLFQDYDPLQDNIFAPKVKVPYEVLIKEFLFDLTGLIIKYRYKADLGDAAGNLLREYANRVKEPLVLTFDSVEVHGTKIAENSETGTSLFTAGATVRVVDGTEKQPNLAWGLVTKGGQALPGWLADLVTIDPATGAVSLKSMPDFEALKTQDGVRPGEAKDEAKGELSLDVTVRVTATDGDRTLWRDKTFMLTITDVNEPPKFIAHNLSPLTMTENQLMKEAESLLVVRIGSVPEGFAGFQVTDPDAGDEVTLRLATGKDAALFELVQLDDGRFALMWKAGADGRRQDEHHHLCRRGRGRDQDPRRDQ